MKKIFFYIILALVGWSLSCDANNPDGGTDGIYPTMITPLTVEKQAALQKEFDALSNGEVCARLDEYGFLGDVEISPCLIEGILRTEFLNDEKALQMAKEALIRYSKFSGIKDTTMLEVKRTFDLGGCIRCDGSEGDITTIGWRFDFDHQIYEGLEVLNTMVFAFVNTEKVYHIGGHWYPETYIPESDQVSQEEAKASLVGFEITYYDWTGEKVLTVTEDIIGSAVEKVVFPLMPPLNNDDTFELRVAWRIHVAEDGWYVYMDTTTGEAIAVNQNIYFLTYDTPQYTRTANLPGRLSGIG